MKPLTRKQMQDLQDLRSDIIDKIFKDQWHDVWFYPRYKGVEGYFGIQNVIFLCINPSTGNFPSKADELFYDELCRQGFHEAHLTDIFKQRAKGNNPK
ncbi:MAG: hypothetical protein ACE5KK_02255 [Candidatus Brocadiales bacterium]